MNKLKKDTEVAFSTNSNPEQAAREVSQKLAPLSPKLVLYFTSSSYDQPALAKAMGENFKGVETMGCTTAGEIVSGKMLKNSLVAMAFSDAVIQNCKTVTLTNIKEKLNFQDALSKLTQHFGESVQDMDYRKYFGFVLTDGLSGCEEKVNDRLGDLTNVQFLGGSAGDDLGFKKTWVHANGTAYSDASVICLIQPKVKFEILKTQSFKILNKKLVATKVDEATRTVHEFNNKPATIAYAEALGVSPADLGNKFMSNPVGLIVDGKPFVRSPQRIVDTSIVFYCQILQGMEVNILEAEDIVKQTQADLNQRQKEFGQFGALINFHCILRTLELEAKNQTQPYGEIFSNIPTIGFSTYGESYIGHINQTSTILGLGKSAA